MIEEPKTKSKHVPVTKQMVWTAYKKVRQNGGSAGVDRVNLNGFDKNKEKYLYKTWNRMASGSYFPPAVKEVEIPKADGKKRKLGIPTISGRIAQMVAKDYLEPGFEKIFHENSYGYRPRRSAHDALQRVRENCWRYDWVIDLDIKGFFDNIDHDLLMKSVERHIGEKWAKMYITRWPNAPVKQTDGTLIKKQGKGAPQGGVISPLLANLFLHYTLDKWLTKYIPGSPFARYADDMIVHCKTKGDAEFILLKIRQRLKECKLELSEAKTKIVYCKDYRRQGKGNEIKFDFLGFSFQPRTKISKFTGRPFLGFECGLSRKARKKIIAEIRSFNVLKISTVDIEQIARELNPKLRGWINYYGKFRRGELHKLFKILTHRLIKWVKKKFKLTSVRKAYFWLQNELKNRPALFAHWQAGFKCI